MTVNEVCTYFDRSEVVDTQIEIDREYYSAMGTFFSDGDVKYNMTREAYLHITSVQNATYLIFVDREYNTCLCVYKYIPEITCKYIIENLHIIQNKIKKSNEYVNEDVDIDPIDEHVNDDVIDINTFTCVECDSKEKMVFVRSKTNPDLLETKCSACKAEYTFMPSKYYKLASKRIIYFKSEDSSRQIDIVSHSTTVIDYTTISQTDEKKSKPVV